MLGDLKSKFKSMKWVGKVASAIHGHTGTLVKLLPQGNIVAHIRAAILPGGMLRKVTNPAASAAVISDVAIVKVFKFEMSQEAANEMDYVDAMRRILTA